MAGLDPISGDVPGFGPLDAADSRTLAGLLSRNPANQWCVTLTDRAGHPIAHACVRTGSGHGGNAGPGTRPGPGDRAPPTGPSRDRPPATGPPGTEPPGTVPPAATAVPASTQPSDWLRSLIFTTLQTRNCTHPKESPGYQPSRSLRHLIEIRNPTCTAPDCRRAAAQCDLDHVTPYHHGGRTCECNLGPASKT